MTSSSSLCPGYKQVEAFGPDDEYDDEEVSYVTLDLGSIEPTLVPSSSTYRLIGLDTPTPFLQLSGTILKGKHASLLGTELVFTDGKDPNDASKKAVTYVASTEQRVCFREIRLHPKGTLPPPGTAKGKTKEATLDGWVAEAEAASHMVNRVTGKNAPRARAPRRSVGGSSGSTRITRAKGRGKGKAKAQDDEEYAEDQAMEVDEDGGGDGGDDDAYEP